MPGDAALAQERPDGRRRGRLALAVQPAEYGSLRPLKERARRVVRADPAGAGAALTLVVAQRPSGGGPVNRPALGHAEVERLAGVEDRAARRRRV